MSIETQEDEKNNKEEAHYQQCCISIAHYYSFILGIPYVGVVGSY